MALNSVNVSLFKKMVTNGAINLKNNHKEIDQLNVFPVPDGDTGINMQMTIMSGVREMNSTDSSSLIDTCKVLSRGSLMGARGNSGVILSQFFRGIYVATKDITGDEISVADFIVALRQGSDVAYKAVMTPVEGTILTVLRESIETVESMKDSIESIEDLFDVYLNQAKISLDNTPNLLPVLKEAGVVDSGGAGFVKIVEGMIMALKGKMLEVVEDSDVSGKNAAEMSSNEINYSYCTEFIIDLANPDNFDESDLKSPFSLVGDSIVLLKDENLVKTHIHTNCPGYVLETAQKYGDFVSVKIENMKLQHSNLEGDLKSKTEFKNNAPKAKPRKKYALVAVCLGEGISSTFKDLGVDYVIEGGQTMNPSTEAFVRAINTVNAENIIIIPNNGNVILAAEQAAKISSEFNVRVLRAKTIAQGYASLMVFDTNSDMDTNIAEMMKAVEHVKTGEVTYSIRDTEINGVQISKNDYMGIVDGEITVSTKERVKAVHELLKQKVDCDSAIVTFFYGKDVSNEEVSGLQDYCTSLNEDVEVEIIEGKQEIYSYIIAIE